MGLTNSNSMHKKEKKKICKNHLLHLADKIGTCWEIISKIPPPTDSKLFPAIPLCHRVTFMSTWGAYSFTIFRISFNLAKFWSFFFMNASLFYLSKAIDNYLYWRVILLSKLTFIDVYIHSCDFTNISLNFAFFTNNVKEKVMSDTWFLPHNCNIFE